MKKLRKKFFIFRLLYICVEIVICSNFKPECKQDRKKDSNWPYNRAHSSRSIISVLNTSAKSKELPIVRNTCYNTNYVSHTMDIQPIQIADPSLNIYNAFKSFHDANANTASSSNIQEFYYRYVDSYDSDDTGNDANVSTIYLNPELTSDSPSRATLRPISSITINPLKVDSTTKSTINTMPYSRKLEHRYIIRNYTSYIENIDKAVFLSSTGCLRSNKVDSKTMEAIKNWNSDAKTDIWTMVKNINSKFLLLKRILQNMMKTDPDKRMPNPLFYIGFLNDLVYYNKIHMPAINRYHNYIHTKKKRESLGDIWLNKEVNLYCCCSGIDRQINIKGKEKDIQLKKKLNAILLIPEVYEDFYKMSVSAINEFKKEIMCNGESDNINEYLNDLKKELPHTCPIISYLIHTAQKDEILAEKSYNEIKQIKLPRNIGKLIKNFNTVDVYNLVLNTVRLFYTYYGVSYRLKSSQKCVIINRTPLIHINNMCMFRSHSKILGVNSVMAQKHFKFTAKIKNICIAENSMLNPNFVVINLTDFGSIAENNPLLTIKDHYHVQFVDNVWHTVTMVHLPYYIYRQKNGTIKNYQFHTIKDIINYLERAINIKDATKYGKSGCIYPFKYSKQNKTWSIMTEESNLNKTVQTIESENCNMVFYCIKENIYETEFCFAQFVYSSEVKNNVKDDNMDKIRIPLFLPRIMVSGAALGPYDENNINYNVFRLGEYKDLTPIDYTEVYTTPPFNSDSRSSNSQTDDSILSEIKRHMKESDLNYAIKHYYSDFFIRNSTDFYEDPQCYCMNIQQGIDENTSNVNITWNTRIYESVYEYTTYKFDSKIRDERTRMGVINQPAHVSFIDMLQRKNPSLNTALYGHCFYKSHAEVDYKTSSVFCLTMKDLLERMNAYLVDKNTKDEIIDPISMRKLYKKDYDPKFILKDVSSAIQNSKLEEIKQSDEGILYIRDNNYNGCKYGIHYDILSSLINTDRITQKSRLKQLKKPIT
ncbi:uncharacterized protein NEPG_01313 [Nematocida parisii ERTm1]|uniref:uncharacterized protein n=1 Tax=Nematocida parisii (strain ERTm1 / ATCC PRA-289) TaxID=881290 RepID=UPI000264B334|nr:uncharacterized protein NEPG_01313 [Nematocida parisii ERTm1]EIJ93741.1 hypothetical protein NEPG_01313 [Nematocida parisii ERTm1]|eukprot:XP_013059141.1 hypothetical protein NEPG_01313 [Nematocida parisii ERTm1]